MTEKPEVLIVGGGMITQMQILPSIYQLQRLKVVGDVSICALNSPPLKALAEDRTLDKAFPGHSFTPYPALKTDPNQSFPDIYKDCMAKMVPGSIVVVAVPDQLHNTVIQAALDYGQHICCVKPLVLEHTQAQAIERIAYEKGLMIGIEYHKRLDDRAHMARRQYRNGQFGQFKLGQAALHEPWYYRHSNFQNWCTCQNSDMFAYVACHYIDQVHFITGLLPTAVSVYGIKDEYPNGNVGYLWTDGRVIWENGACLNVQNAMAYPNDAPGGNWQGLRMYCKGDDDIGAMIVHDDQYRGVKHSYVAKGDAPGDSIYAEPSPDYLKYIDLGGGGLTPVGYGYRSVEFIIKKITECRRLGDDLPQRQRFIKQVDDEGVMATPANSFFNELVMEAGRLSILNDAREVTITYGQNPKVEFRTY